MVHIVYHIYLNLWPMAMTIRKKGEKRQMFWTTAQYGALVELFFNHRSPSLCLLLAKLHRAPGIFSRLLVKT